MKKTLIIAVVLCSFSAAGMYAQFTHLGAGLSYGSEVEEPGIGAYGIYSVNPQIDIVPNFTWFLPHKTDYMDGYRDYYWWSLSIDGHYNALEWQKIQAYGLMGLNFTNVTEDYEYQIQTQVFEDRNSELEAGLNMGVGGSIQLSGVIHPFVEVKYTFGMAEQFAVTAGILIRIAPDREPASVPEE